MVLLVQKWDIHPDKLEAYTKWTESAIQRTLAVPGVVEFRAYRAATGPDQVLRLMSSPTWLPGPLGT